MKGRPGYPRLTLTNPYKEVDLGDLQNPSPEMILREAEKYQDDRGRSRLLWACDRFGAIIREQSRDKNRMTKKKNHQGREDFDRVKYRVMKKFFIRMSQQKVTKERRPFDKRRQFRSNRYGNKPIIRSRMREGGTNHGGSNKR